MPRGFRNPRDAECKVPGCGRRSRMILGFCPRHYRRWRDTGDAASIPGRTSPWREQEKGMYTATCSKCGKELLSETLEGECPGCGQRFRLEWPARLPDGKKLGPQGPEPTISGKEGLK